MPRNLNNYHPAALNAIERFVDVAFRSGDSLFTPGEAIWGRDNRARFYERFVEHPDESDDTFMAKYERQLSGASAAVVQLGAEVLYVQLIAPWGIGRQKKTSLVEEVLSWSPRPVEIPGDLKDAFERGLARDQSFMQHRPFHLAWLMELLRAWDGLEAERRERVLGDPWEFKAFARSVPAKSAQPMREMLYFFVHPDSFESISSRRHKRMIVEAFRDELDRDADDLDQNLLAIRQKLSRTHGEGFHFYENPVVELWRGKAAKQPTGSQEEFLEWAERFRNVEDFEKHEVQYKLAVAERVGEARKAVIAGEPDWHTKLKHAFEYQSGLTAWQAHDRLLKWCEANPDTAREALATLWSEEDDENSRMRGFLKHLPREVASGTGTRTSLMSFLLLGVNPRQYPMFRPTVMKQAYKLAGYRRLPPGADEVQRYNFAREFLQGLIDQSKRWDVPIRDQLEAQGVVWSLAKRAERPVDWAEEEWQRFLHFREGEAVPGPPGDRIGDDEEDEEALPALAQRLFLPPEFLDRIRRLLEDKRQVIFYGPPGTGKTYVAQQIAEVLAGDPSRVTLVQFHPSYTYEDFFEGYRPRASGGNVSFELVPGPMKRLADQARAHPSQQHVLVVDEINRGNLSKVLGELYSQRSRGGDFGRLRT